ncbi:MAG: paraquat-inducible protein A [Rhodobacteraceae bacterium]|nr:paraquat-inducible protein A [Paracoccaceae bacterium]
MLKLLNLSLLVLFPVAWFAPMANAGLLPWFGRTDISVITSISSLWETDVFLASLVAGFAIVAPTLKTLLLAAIHLGWLGSNMLDALAILAKLAMADIFLIALLIVMAKGVGIGQIETGWGIYLFTFCVMLSMLVTELTKKQMKAH